MADKKSLFPTLKFPTPKSPWVAAFWLDLASETGHYLWYKGYWQEVGFFLISSAVVALIWLFEKKSR